MTDLSFYPWPRTCTSEGCRLRGALISHVVAEAGTGTCGSCAGPLRSIHLDLTERQRVVLHDYPLPIATAYARSLSRTEAEARIKALTDAFAEALRLSALVVKSEYLHSDCVDADVNQIITRDLARPLISSWKKLADKAIPALTAASHSFFVPDLVAFHERHLRGGKPAQSVRLPGRAYDSFGDQQATHRRLTPIGALLSFRNEFAHSHAHDEEAMTADLATYGDLLLHVLTDMGWWRRFRLCRETPTERSFLTGLRATTEPSGAVASRERLFLVRDDGCELDLYPFLIAPGALFADALAGEDLLIYEQSTGRRMYYVSAAGTSRSTRETVATWQRLMQSKQAVQRPLAPDDATADEIARRAAAGTRQTRSVLFDSKKLLDGVYAERPRLDDHLAAWPSSGYPLLALAGAAGSGKTALIHHAAQAWERQGHAVLLLRAQLLTTSRLERALAEELGLTEGADLAVLAARATSEERQLIVVLDGANEHRDYADLMCSAVELASTLQGIGCLRIAVTFRSDIADWFLEKQEHQVLREASATGQTNGFHNHFYMRRNADVRNVYGGGGDAMPHYLEYGGNEGRMPNPFSFDARYYVRRYAADPQVSLLEGAEALYSHFCEHGVRRGYRPNHFGLMKHVDDNRTLLFEAFSCLQCGAPLPKDEQGRFDIWINSNEEPEPRRHCDGNLELRFYKFCSLSCAREKEQNIPVIPARGNAERGLFYPPLERGADALAVDDKPATLVGRLGADETRSMWDAYVRRGGANYRPLFRFDDFARASTALQSDLANPLLLRTFLQLYAGRQLPETVSRCSLLDAWFERLGDEDESAQELLLDIARICLEQERAALDLDELFQDPRTRAAVQAVHVGSTYTLLSRRHGVLSEFPRADRIEIAFSVESFFEYALGRVLEQDGDADTPERLAARIRASSGTFALLRGGVAMALERRTAASGTGYLYDFLDAADEAGVELAGALIGRVASRGDVPAIVRGLLARPTSADLGGVLAATRWLDDQDHVEALGALLEQTLAALPPALEDVCEARALRAAMAEHLARLGRPGDAAAQQQRVVDDVRQTESATEADVGAALQRLGLLLREVHLDSDALAALLEAGERFDHAGASGSIDAARARSEAARTLVATGHSERARALLEPALEVLEQAYGAEHLETVQTRSLLGVAVTTCGDTDTGLQLARRALAEAQRHLANRRASYVDQLANVAVCHELRGEYTEALRFSRLAVDAAARLGGDANRRAVACRKRLLRSVRDGGGEEYAAALDGLRNGDNATDKLLLAELLLEGAATRHAEARALLEALVARGHRPAMLTLADALEGERADRAAALRASARALQDPPPVA